MRKMQCWAALGLFAASLSACAGLQKPKDSTSPGAKKVELLRVTCFEAEQEANLKACRDLLRMRPNEGKTEDRIGWMLLDRGDVPEGMAHLWMAVRLSPREAVYHYHYAVGLEKRGNRAESEEAYRKAVELKPDYPEAKLALGVVLRKVGKKEESMTTFQEILKKDPGSATTWGQLSLTLAQMDRSAEAIEAARKAVELQPEDPNARSNLGLFFVNANQASQGIEHLQKALELEPNNPKALYNLALAYTQTNSLEEAARAFYLSIVLKDTFGEAHHSLGVILLSLGLCNECREHLDRSHALGVKSESLVLDRFREMCNPTENKAAEQPAAGKIQG